MGKRQPIAKTRNNLGFIDSQLMNNQTYTDYLDRFKKIALSIFEWVNLPDSMDSRYLELSLYYDGVASLLRGNTDTIKGLINTRCCPSGYVNIYGLPTSLNCWSYSYQEQRKLFTGTVPEGLSEQQLEAYRNSNAVMVLNNWDRVPTEPTLALYAMRLAEAERASDTNIKASKTPVMILVGENQRLTMENLYAQFDGNRPFIFGDKKQMGDMDSIKAINTEAPIVFDKLQDYKKEIFNEALTFLGINNIMLEKAERLVTDEANANNELINLNLQAALVPRQKAAEQFNKLFGLTGNKAISVRVRSDLHNIIKEAESIVNDYKDMENIEDITIDEEEGGNE